MLSSIYVSAQRSVENSAFGMKLFGMSTVLNTGLNYLLIFGKCGLPALGVEGAAIATLLSRVAEFAVCLFCALRSKVIPLDMKALARPGGEMLRRFVKYASPVMGNELMWGLGNSLLTVILGHTTVSAARYATDTVVWPRMTVSRLLPKPHISSLPMTGEAYFTNRRSISPPGRASAFRSSGITLLRRAQTRHTANSATRESSVAMAAPSTPSMGKPHLPKISR